MRPLREIEWISFPRQLMQDLKQKGGVLLNFSSENRNQ